MKPLALVALLYTSTTLFAQGGNSLDEVFAKMDEVSKTFRSIEANIEQTLVTTLVDSRDVKSGKFYYVRAGKDLRVKTELTKPVEETILIDKGKFQDYLPGLNQVQEALLGASNDQAAVAALGFGQSSAELKAKFDVTLGKEETINGKKTVVLDLKPKSSGMFKSVRMWLDPQKWIAVQLRINEKGNDYMIINFTSPKLNGGVPDSRFKLDLKNNVKVIKW